MNIITSDVHVFGNIGEINDIKANRLSETFGTEFSLERSNEKLIILEKKDLATIMISSDSIVYRIKGDNFDKTEIVKQLEVILSSLMVEFEGNCVLDISAIGDGKGNAFDDSLKDVSLQNENKKFCNSPGLKGIGLRFINETDEYNEDFKKEPYLAERDKYFYRVARIYKKKMSLEELIDKLEKLINCKENEFIEG